MKVVWRSQAQADFVGQITYVQADNPSAALRMKMAVELGVANLEYFPRMGRLVQHAEIRELIVPSTPYLVVYQVGASEVTILRLFHASQDRS